LAISSGIYAGLYGRLPAQPQRQQLAHPAFPQQDRDPHQGTKIAGNNISNVLDPA
jgi:hypothetical protein